MGTTYPSPTTPGLTIDFKNLVVELVCLNMDAKLPARFWLDRKYWAPKYAREVRGFSKLIRLHDDVEDPVFQRAAIDALKESRVQTLLNERNLSRLDRLVRKKMEILMAQREQLAAQAPETIPAEQYMERNTRLTNLGRSSRISKILEIERGQEEEQGTRH